MRGYLFFLHLDIEDLCISKYLISLRELYYFLNNFSPHPPLKLQIFLSACGELANKRGS